MSMTALFLPSNFVRRAKRVGSFGLIDGGRSRGLSSPFPDVCPTGELSENQKKDKGKSKFDNKNHRILDRMFLF